MKQSNYFDHSGYFCADVPGLSRKLESKPVGKSQSRQQRHNARGSVHLAIAVLFTDLAVTSLVRSKVGHCFQTLTYSPQVSGCKHSRPRWHSPCKAFEIPHR
jgi:hypothetical protein